MFDFGVNRSGNLVSERSAGVASVKTNEKPNRVDEAIRVRQPGTSGMCAKKGMGD